MDPTIPVSFETLKGRLSRETAPERFNTALVGLFAILALVLASIGLYGVTAFLVRRRTRELGLRLAVGATPASNVALALGAAARYSVVGIAIGTAGSLAVSRTLDSMLYEVPSPAPWILAASLVALATVSLTAAGLAARRAARVDPLVALRHE
jgi:putative ABC transport system permease protein